MMLPGSRKIEPIPSKGGVFELQSPLLHESVQCAPRAVLRTGQSRRIPTEESANPIISKTLPVEEVGAAKKKMKDIANCYCHA